MVIMVDNLYCIFHLGNIIFHIKEPNYGLLRTTWQAAAFEGQSGVISQRDLRLWNSLFNSTAYKANTLSSVTSDLSQKCQDDLALPSHFQGWVSKRKLSLSFHWLSSLGSGWWIGRTSCTHLSCMGLSQDCFSGDRSDVLEARREAADRLEVTPGSSQVRQALYTMRIQMEGKAITELDAVPIRRHANQMCTENRTKFLTTHCIHPFCCSVNRHSLSAIHRII